MRVVVNCSTKERAIAEVVYYGAKGKPIYSSHCDSSDWEFIAPPPESKNEGEMNVICNLARERTLVPDGQQGPSAFC